MTRRQETDHARYMRHREERLSRQRAYYAANREKCRESVKRSQRKAFIRNYERGETSAVADG